MNILRGERQNLLRQRQQTHEAMHEWQGGSVVMQA
jgi:hypothetical protein